MIYIRWRNII